MTRLLARLVADVEVLRSLGEPGEVLADDRRLDAAKYRFITAIEGLTKVAQHVVASEGWDAPDTNADALRRLGEHRVIDADLTASLTRAVGFRNVLVHRYLDVDDAVVATNLSRLDDLDSFARQVASWLDAP